MSRPVRIEYENAWYHVMNRGINQQDIFFNDYHRKIFLGLLEQINIKFKVEIHAYCLMSNHYHLLIKTPTPNLNRAMQKLNSVYALRLNRDRKTDGPVFRGRYKAIVVEKNSYLLQVSRYIHLNPVEANICKSPEAYRWSSYRCYLGKAILPKWLFIDETLLQLGNVNQISQYKLFMSAGVDSEINGFYQRAKLNPILGSQDFSQALVKKYINTPEIHEEISEKKILKSLKMPTIREIMSLTANYYDVSFESLTTSRQGVLNIPRSIAIYLAAKITSEIYKVIAKEFHHLNAGAVSNVYIRISKLILNNSALEKDVKTLLNMMQDET